MSTDSLSSLQMIAVDCWNASAYYGATVSRVLKEAGVAVTVASWQTNAAAEKAGQWKIPLIDDVNLQQPQHFIRDFRRLNRFLAEQPPQIINTHRPEDMLYAALLLQQKQLRHIPLVRTVSDVRPPKRNPINSWLHKKAAAHFIFTCRSSFKRYMNVWPVFENRSSIIHSAIDTAAFIPRPPSPILRQKLGLADGQIVVSLIARLAAIKDHDNFLQAAARVVSKSRDCLFLIAGEAVDYDIPHLRKKASELGIADRVLFLPREDASDVRDIISISDIGVVCSKGSEVICRIATEYMAIGKPVVATDVNVLPEMIKDGINGRLVARENHEALAGAILELIANHDLCRQMGIAGRALCESKFSYKTLVAKTCDVYREVLSRCS